MISASTRREIADARLLYALPLSALDYGNWRPHCRNGCLDFLDNRCATSLPIPENVLKKNFVLECNFSRDDFKIQNSLSTTDKGTSCYLFKNRSIVEREVF